MAGAYRRFYLYSALSIAVIALAAALAMAISLTLGFAGSRPFRPSESEVRTVAAFVAAVLMVAAPVGVVHVALIHRELPHQGASDVRHFFLNLWIFGALMVALIAMQTLASSTVPGTQGRDLGPPIAGTIVAAIVGLIAWRWRAATPPHRLRWENDAAYGAMVVSLLIGLPQLARAVEAYLGLSYYRGDQMWTGAWTSLAALLVWTICAVWQRDRRTEAIRLRYLVTFHAVGVALLAATLDLELARLARLALGHGSPPAVTTFLPQLAIGAALVALHTPLLLSDRGRNGRPRDLVERVTAAPVALVGLGLIAAAAVQGWTYVVDHALALGGMDDPLDHAATASVPAVLGLLTYPFAWRALRTGEVGDTTRRFVLFTVVCLALGASVIASAAALFELISGALAWSFTRSGLHGLATWTGIAAIALTLFASHLALLRRDRDVPTAETAEAKPAVAGCLVCERVARIRSGTNPTFIAATPHAYAVLGDRQYLRGYSLLLWPAHVEHLHDLRPQAREEFLSDMAALGVAMWQALRPERLNYAIAGGLIPHLHAHVFPRWADEPDEYRQGPVGAYPREIRDAPENAFDVGRDSALIHAIRDQLQRASEAG